MAACLHLELEGILGPNTRNAKIPLMLRLSPARCVGSEGGTAARNASPVYSSAVCVSYLILRLYGVDAGDVVVDLAAPCSCFASADRIRLRQRCLIIA